MSIEIKIFKLVSGEEILSTVVEETETSFILENPSQIAVQPREDGSMGLVVAAFMPYSKDTVTINKFAVSASCYPAEGLANEYKAKFTDEPLIQVPDRKIII